MFSDSRISGLFVRYSCIDCFLYISDRFLKTNGSWDFRVLCLSRCISKCQEEGHDVLSTRETHL